MEKLPSKKLILASSSPRRKELLRMLGVEFKIVQNYVKEKKISLNLPPGEYVNKLSYLKASDVASRTSNAIVVAADTVVFFKNKILGKPRNEKEAKEMLRKLSGRTHQVFTGISIIDTETKQTERDVVVTKVKFGKEDKYLIKKYVLTKDPIDKAGSYGIQGRGALLIESIDGDYFNVVGLPLYALNQLLKKIGISLML